ncbi:YheC/YheD family protein [Acinetobacter sp. V102_4]|uniref:YheC/YheD family protein n=1 Tax=Acinetobacter sp. V102_4 TaxID=3072984 RepID=UPI00287E6C9B|nr:YheC/YheD family protein [Acinetobacter sp. V102_4]MDS7929389.1 YheC/YheD family protein [Acinetobacter sp. V102_4]
MSIFGILKPAKNLTDVEEIFIIVAQSRGHEAYVFTAKDVCFETEKIVGKTILNGKVLEKEFNFPHVIQNRLAVKAEDKEIYLKLAEKIPFTSNRIGTKKNVDLKLKKIEDINEFLISVEDCKEFDDLLNAIQKYKKVILKPLSSNQGKGIFSVEFLDKKYIVKQLDKKNEFNKNELRHFFDKDIKNKGYSLSKYFNSCTNNSLNTVFRMQISRGAGGKWKLIKFFPYVNINKNIDITNGMQGALITTREKMFLEQYYPNSFEKINKSIKKIFEKFPLAFQKQYAWRLDSLGLDLGIDQEGNIAIFEVNAGPGIGFMAYPVAKAQVDYYEWLQENAKPPFKNNFLPINLR